MTRINPNQEQAQDEAAELRSRLAETEETLRAIQDYMVDAFVVNRENRIQVVTLNETEIPYRMMVELMNEGAVTLIPDGTIFYCNSRFGEMVETDCEKLIGTSFLNFLPTEEQSAFEAILKQARQEGVRSEFCLKTSNGKCLPVQLSIYLLGTEPVSGISIIATDIGERVQAQEKIQALVSKLAVAEQEERHRISQILHDDLQQRLFAIKAQLYFLKDPGGKHDILPSMYMDFDEVQNALSEAIAVTRNLSIDLSPIILHGEGLTDALTWLASRMQEQHGLQVELQIKEDPPQLDDHMRVLLFQAVRELLFNVVKHAGTKEAGVTLEKVDGNVRITISDAGKGFEVGTVLSDPKAAHGLLIIQDRLELVGGGIEVISKLGDGTRAVIKVPLKATHH